MKLLGLLKKMIKLTNLWEKTLYTNPSEFIITPIYEYDISKANISVLLDGGHISKSEYDYYSSLSRIERQIKIGILQKNPIYVKILDDGFKKARHNLCLYNNLEDGEIVSIKKDSLFVTRALDNIVFGKIHFVLKNIYGMLIKINKLEIFFGNNNGAFNLDIKGINDNVLVKHQQSYLSMFCELLSMVQSHNFQSIVQYILDFMYLYDNRSLPIEFYREFNQTSMYKLSNIYYSDYISESDLPYIDISYNHEFNREIYKVMSSIFFTYLT